MGEGRLTWEECLPVVKAEARRWAREGEQIGLDPDDLTQEASIAAVQCLKKWRPEGGGRSAYVRTAIRNRFANVRKEAMRKRRMPHDAQGRPRPDWLVRYETSELQFAAAFDNSSQQESRLVLEALRRQLPPGDWEFLVRTLVEGAHLARGLAPGQRQQLNIRLREVRSRARHILSGILQTHEALPMNAVIPEPTPKDLPECHAAGSQPQGYDREDPVCWNCRDKFSCLPNALDRHLVLGKLSDDCEIHAVLNDEMSFRAAIERMKTRLRILQSGGEIPPQLDVRTPLANTGIRAVPSPVEAPEPPVEAAPEPDPPAPKPKPSARPSKRRKRSNKELVNGAGWPTLKNGKPLPPVRQLTEGQMRAALGRVKIGQPFPLEVGMQLVRKTKDGDTVIVKLVPTGFQLDGVIYSALSTACMYRLRKVTSGNAYFHLETNQCTEIWDEDGKVLAGYSTA